MSFTGFRPVGGDVFIQFHLFKFLKILQFYLENVIWAVKIYRLHQGTTGVNSTLISKAKLSSCLTLDHKGSVFLVSPTRTQSRALILVQYSVCEMFLKLSCHLESP